MAEEETKTEEVTEPVVDETAADTTEVTTKAADETKVAAPEPSEAEKKLTEQMSELQGKFDSLAQDGVKDKQLLEELTPFVDWEGMKTGRAGTATDELSEEGEPTFLTQQDAKALEKRVEQKIATNQFIQDFRTNYPDLADKGPKEELVRFFFDRKTLRTDSFDKRLEGAVKATRDLLKSEQDKGAEKIKTDEEKAAQEKKAKDEAAAKASGLSSTGITSPKTSEESKETETPTDYIASRKERLENLRKK